MFAKRKVMGPGCGWECQGEAAIREGLRDGDSRV